jgi:hypothetical protein
MYVLNMLIQVSCRRKFTPTYAANLTLLGCRYLSVPLLAVILLQAYHHYAIFCGVPVDIFVQNVDYTDRKPV